MALRTWSANGSFYADRIVQFLLADQERRLDFGYDASIGSSDSFVAISRMAIAAAGLSCSDNLFQELERAVLFFTPERERKHRFVGRTELALLRGAPQQANLRINSKTNSGVGAKIPGCSRARCAGAATRR